MENGDRQRQMDFILNTLADVTTKISSLAESHERLNALIDIVRNGRNGQS